MGLLDVAGQDEHEDVAGAQPVVLVHRPGLDRLKPGRRAAEGFQPEEFEALRPEHVDRVGEGVGPGRVCSQSLQRVEDLLQRVRQLLRRILKLKGVHLGVTQDAQGADGIDGARAGPGQARGVGAGEISVEKVLGVAGGPQPRPDLIGRESGQLEPLTELLDHFGILQRLPRLIGGGQLTSLPRGNLRRDRGHPKGKAG